MSLPAETRKAIPVPVRFVFGMRDNLVGDPVKAGVLVSDMQNASVSVVEAGHLMGAEIPAEIDTIILDFFANVTN